MNDFMNIKNTRHLDIDFDGYVAFLVKVFNKIQNSSKCSDELGREDSILYGVGGPFFGLYLDFLGEFLDLNFLRSSS